MTGGVQNAKKKKVRRQGTGLQASGEKRHVTGGCYLLEHQMIAAKPGAGKTESWSRN